MSYIVIDLQSSDAWKIQLKIVINFISSKDAEEVRVMHSSSDHIKFTCYNNANEVIGELFESLRSTINPKNMVNKCFQYATTLALNYEQIKWNPERVSNIKPFIDKYNWKGINYPSKIDDWKTFEKNNPSIALNISYIKEKKSAVYISKINSNCDKQIILLMIPNEEKKG